MTSQEEGVQTHALRGQGWTVSAIARYSGRDRKTIRAYLNGDREPGLRKRPASADPSMRSRLTFGSDSLMTRTCGRLRLLTRLSDLPPFGAPVSLGLMHG